MASSIRDSRSAVYDQQVVTSKPLSPETPELIETVEETIKLWKDFAQNKRACCLEEENQLFADSVGTIENSLSGSLQAIKNHSYEYPQFINAEFFECQVKEKVCGFAIVFLRKEDEKTCLVIQDLAVHPCCIKTKSNELEEVQGGIESALIKGILERCLEDETIDFLRFSSKTSSAGFYERLGFQVTEEGERPSFVTPKNQFSSLYGNLSTNLSKDPLS